MQCPIKVESGENYERCDFEGTLREVGRHRHSEHGEPKWDIAHDLPAGEPDAEWSKDE